MDILSNLTNLLGQAAGGETGRPQPKGGSSDGLAGLLNSDALGGLVSALLSGKGGGGAPAAGGSGMGGELGAIGGLLGSLLGGEGGGILQQLMPQGGGAAGAGGRAPAPAASSASPQVRAANLLRALVYAAKADGNVDPQEQAAINSQVQKLGLGSQAQNIVNQAMNESLDPNRIARDVGDSQEAMQIYAMSCAVTNRDHFMEKNYLDALATALRLPPEIKSGIESRLAGK